MTRVETVTFVHQGERILLALKKRGRLGVGKYNGFGGGVEDGESLEDCAIRETKEEAGIVVVPKKRGQLYFTFPDDTEDRRVHVFTADTYVGEPTKSDEMDPEWFRVKDIPYQRMWCDDKFWLPELLMGNEFVGYFNFNIYGGIAKHNLVVK